MREEIKAQKADPKTGRVALEKRSLVRGHGKKFRLAEGKMQIEIVPVAWPFA